MNDNRLGGLALILGALSGIVTLTFHPSGGPHRVNPAQFEILIAVVIGVHALALTGLPISFAGTIALTRQIDSPTRLAMLGLITYGFGAIAVMLAATMSGLVTPALLREIVGQTGSADQSHMLIGYTHSLNQAFARLGAIASSVAIVVWSAVMVRGRSLSRTIGVYGLISGVVIVFALASGRLDVELHGFRILTLIQAVWFALAGVFLWRTAPAVMP